MRRCRSSLWHNNTNEAASQQRTAGLHRGRPVPATQIRTLQTNSSSPTKLKACPPEQQSTFTDQPPACTHSSICFCPEVFGCATEVQNCRQNLILQPYNTPSCTAVRLLCSHSLYRWAVITQLTSRWGCVITHTHTYIHTLSDSHSSTQRSHCCQININGLNVLFYVWSTLSAPAERTEPSWIQISWHRDSAQLHTVGPCRRVSSQREKRLIQWKQVNVFECSWNYECLVSTRSDTCGWFTETPEGHIQVFYPQKTGEVMKCNNKLKSRSRQQNEAALLSPLWVSCSEFSCRFITLTCSIMLIGLIMCCYT